MHKVLAFGHQGKRPEALQALLGERYVWVRELGKLDY